MKYAVRFLLTALLCGALFVMSNAQVGINANNGAPDSSAMLDVSATDKGLLMPRMSTTQRTAISNPANGLMVYDEMTQTYWYFDKNQWNEIRNGSLNLSILDLFDSVPADFSCLTITGSVTTGPAPKSVAVAGNYAYVVDDISNDLKVINISAPNSPMVTGSLVLGTSAFPVAVAVAGNYAYVIDRNSADLKVINVETPTSPSLAGSVALGTNPQITSSPAAIAVAGEYAYVLDNGSDELLVINISTTDSPFIAQRLSIGTPPLTPRDIAIAGNFAYVVESISEEILVIDISNPTTSFISGRLTIGVTPRAVAVAGNYAYVVDLVDDDLRIIDVSNPSSPTLAGTMPLGSAPVDVVASGLYVFVVDFGSDDLKVIDVSNPASPNLVSTAPLEATPLSLAVAGNYAYVVDSGSDDLKVIQLTCDQELYLLTDVLDGTISPGPGFNPLWTEASGNVYRNSGNVGIGTSTVNMPLSFPATAGNKIALWGDNANSHYGIGVTGGLLQLYASAIQEDIAFGYGSSTNFIETMRIKGNGSVGIGTSAPQNTLDVEGSLAVGSTYSGTSTAPTNGAIIEGDVGIGTTNTTNGRLVVSGVGNQYTINNGYGFLWTGGADTGGPGATNNYSIFASGAIAANDYNAISDARIKDVIGRSNSQEDLATIMAIEITDYQYIDTLQKGKQQIKKVIAQQVDQVYPQAVKKSIVEVVPDIYQQAQIKDGWIQLATNLQPGERVKIITQTTNQIHEVTAVETHRFQVSELCTDHSAPTTVFVYGREVDDFHTVDYEAIAMLNVSATQEQQKRIEALEEQVLIYHEQQLELQQTNTQLTQRLDRMEAALQGTNSVVNKASKEYQIDK